VGLRTGLVTIVKRKEENSQHLPGIEPELILCSSVRVFLVTSLQLDFRQMP